MSFPDDGFFHALQQAPDDDILRLVYADFLDDRGDEASAAHADLIRVQVKLAALPPNAADAVELTTRQDALLARWQRDWLGDGAEHLDRWTFRRGMVEGVVADAGDFLEHAEEWFGQWPTLTVAKLTGADGLLPELAASPWLAHLRGLDLSDNHIGPAALESLTASRYVSLLQGLDLSDNPIGPRGAVLLSSARSLQELTEVHLARCGLWYEGLLALLGSSIRRAPHWRRLDLAGNGLNRLGLVRLEESSLLGHLEALDLADNPLGDNGATVLADSANAAGLVDLGLCNTETGDTEVSALAASRNLVRLRSLDLRGHGCWQQWDRRGLDIGGIADLAKAPLLGHLRRLLLAQPGRCNGWTAQVLRPVRTPVHRERVRDGWMVNVLRESRHLVPSLLVECDLEELWWLGDPSQRERLPADFYAVSDWLNAFPELLDSIEKHQAAALRLRYGVDENPRSLKEIGDRLGFPLERVREIESAAVAKLRRLRSALPFE